MDQFGDTLYNIYGSTEVFYASIATPSDLRAAPTSAGHPPFATQVRILDDRGRPVPDNHPGRIFVGNSMLFEGYSGGGHKEIVDGLMSTGDVGRYGPDGRLYVEGRDDEMIVSGGENVFPSEVEHCLARHPAVVEATAVGVPDEEFGQRLRAFVATSDPSRRRGRTQALGGVAPGPVQGPSGDRPHRRAASQRHRQDPQAAPPRGALNVLLRGGCEDAAMTGIEIGSAAPDFTLRDQFGQDITLSSFRGSKAVAIFFFPWAFSGVCTGEMTGIRLRLDEFLTFDTEVLAISCDPVYSLRAFADVDGLNFPLLSDFWPHGAVASAYDVFDPAKGCARRSSYVIDQEGTVRWAVHNAMPDGRDLSEHLLQLQAIV